ncbi:Protein-glutamine gamma-glutamyltransferase [Rhodocyclaceae bacterium]|nr:Protein-glutamine gamma-glutamyltransferase [Rhodocyclaceae bacterium]
MKLSAPIIYGLLLSILMVSAPHADHLPLWVSALAAMLLGWRAYLAYSGNPLPARWLLITLTLGSVGAILASFHTLFGREAGVTLLILLATLKLLELRTVRDAMVLIYLACFIIITNFFYSQSIPTALFMLATLLAILTAWIRLQTGTLPFKPRLREGNGEAVGYLAASPLWGLRIASVLLLQAIPLTLILFVLFPRVQGPLWGLPQDAYASSGLDDKMSPGSLSKLSLSDAVAFRVTFTDKAPLREQMYWRGPVLWEFDGRTWTPGKILRTAPPRLDGLSSPIDYTVTLEPHNRTWLFALEMPTQISVPAGLTYDFQVHGKSNVTARLRYTAHSQLGYRANAEENSLQLQRAQVIPRQFNPRAQQLATEWRTSLQSDEEVMRAALGYFNREGFQYTLEPPLLGMHTVDDFLFETRKGFCEHYASSFVFLMRAAGIPARVVTGYQGGAYNGLGNYYIVRQSDAHAWAEVWLRGRGWVRVDPTAVIAPARVQSGLAASVPASDSAALPFLARTQSPWLLKLRLNLDLLANQWNQWVLGYNPERQFAFLTRMGMEEITWQKMAFTMMGGVGVLVGLFALLMLRRLQAQHADKVQTAWLRLCKKLAKSGLPRAPHEGPEDYSVRVARARPHLAAGLQELSRRYIALRYGKRHNVQALREFESMVGAFKP